MNHFACDLYLQNINEFVISKLNATNNTQRRPNRKWPKLNQLLFDFGVLEEKQEESIQFVKNKIIEIDQQFDLGLFAIVLRST